MCTGTPPTCGNTCGRGAATHGDVFNEHTERRVGVCLWWRGEGVSVTHQHQHQHTHTRKHSHNAQRTNAQHTTQNMQGVIASSSDQICPRRVITWPQRFTKKPWILLVFSLRKDREQHVPDSSDHWLYLIQLFNSNNLEETMAGISSLMVRLVSPLLPPPLPPPRPRPRPQPRHTTHRHKDTKTQRHRDKFPWCSDKRAFDLPLWFHVFCWTIKNTTAFEMELCGCKQATVHAHVQFRCMWLNCEHTTNSNRSKKIPATTKIEFGSAN